MDDNPFSSDPENPDDGGATVVKPAPSKATAGDHKPVPRYHVILWDSDDHTYEYVEKMLHELFGHNAEQCFKIAKTVDEKGRAIVLTTTQEHAELKRDQIHAYGKDETMKGCKGSMKATIEEAS